MEGDIYKMDCGHSIKDYTPVMRSVTFPRGERSISPNNSENEWVEADKCRVITTIQCTICKRTCTMNPRRILI